jgi:hypothetical protein
MHSINDGRFLIKYADLSPPPQKLTDFYSKLDNIHQNGANMEEGKGNGQKEKGLFSRLSSAISSSNSKDFGPVSSTAIEFPPSNPLPWYTLNDFEEEYQSLYSQLLTCEEANYSSIASLARQSTEPFSSDSQSGQLCNQLEGASGVKTSGEHWAAAAHQIILPHKLKPSDRIAMQCTCPEDGGVYLYRYRPKVLYHDKLRIKIPVFNDFINIQQVQNGLYSSQINYLKRYLFNNQDDYQIGGIMKVRDGKSLTDGIDVEICHSIDDAIDSGVSLLADGVGSLDNGDSCECLQNELPVGLKKVMKENGIQWLGGPATAQTLLRQHDILPTFRFTATRTNGRKC